MSKQRIIFQPFFNHPNIAKNNLKNNYFNREHDEIFLNEPISLQTTDFSTVPKSFYFKNIHFLKETR